MAGLPGPPQTVKQVGPVLAALALVAPASAQTLGLAGNYDIFVTNGGSLELKDPSQLFGSVGISDSAELDGRNETNIFAGTIFKHTNGTIKDGGGLAPSNGIQSSAAIDADLDQANIDLAGYISYMDGLTASATYGKQTTLFSYDSTTDLTVLDFQEVDLQEVDFTLNGRAGGTDEFIIRVSDFLEFKDANLILNDVQSSNVTWYFSSNGKFDLHKSDNANDPSEFQKFAGVIVAPDAEVRLGEVDFTGKVYGSDLKLGSGAVFVPEPSSSLMILIGGAGLLLRRGRRA